MWLQQEKLPPFLPANFHISITIHPDSGEEGERGRRRREGEEEGEREREGILNIKSLSRVIHCHCNTKANGSGTKG